LLSVASFSVLDVLRPMWLDSRPWEGEDRRLGVLAHLLLVIGIGAWRGLVCLPFPGWASTPHNRDFGAVSDRRSAIHPGDEAGLGPAAALLGGADSIAGARASVGSSFLYCGLVQTLGVAELKDEALAVLGRVADVADQVPASGVADAALKGGFSGYLLGPRFVARWGEEHRPVIWPEVCVGGRDPIFGVGSGDRDARGRLTPSFRSNGMITRAATGDEQAGDMHGADKYNWAEPSHIVRSRAVPARSQRR
jgi:hypothetical protein